MENQDDINKLLVQIVNQFPATEHAGYEQLIRYLNELLLNDFSSLIQLLYRVDIDEQKLKVILANNISTDTAVLLADLLIKRQVEKIAIRKNQEKKDVSGDEEW